MNRKKVLEIVLGVGTYAWCRCGLSRNLPWCDGKHNKEKKTAPLVFYQPEKSQVAICNCGQSLNAPFCANVQDCLPNDT
jgi:CDGSH-type Zn-finger protein